MHAGSPVAPQLGTTREHTPAPKRETITAIKTGLGRRPLVIVGMMGAGKSSIGRRLAHTLSMGFVDSDDEIEKAANLTIPEIFERHGEAHFRDGEHRVIARLVSEGEQVVALGGGAFERAPTRKLVANQAISMWLNADLETLMNRVRRKSHRPLLQTADPEGTMKRLLDERTPNYKTADLVVHSSNEPHGQIVARCIERLADYLSSNGTNS
ncbi:MAG: shikimate kinase [Pseudomonadota bacterium]